MIYTYKPTGVCSRNFVFDIKNGKIQNLEVLGGCNGNLKGLISLIKGMNVEDVILKLKGIKCNQKNTSCPDQIAKALEDLKNGK